MFRVSTSSPAAPTRSARLASSRRTALGAAVLSAVLVVFAGPVAAQDGPPERPPAKVRTAAAVERDVAPTTLVPGTVASRHDSRVAAEAAGRIVFVAEAGDIVALGDPLARIDDAAAVLALRGAEARRIRSEVALRRQNQDVERWRSLSERGNAPESRYEEVLSLRDMAVQDLAEARVAEDRAQVDLDRTTVRAPYAGLVAERLIEVGEYSVPGREIARLVDMEELEARAQAPISTAGFLSVGDDILIADDRGEARTATVRAIVPAGDPLTRTFELRVDLVGTPWLVGSPVRVSVPNAAPRSSITAPRDAVVLRSNAVFVMVVDADNVAHRVDVRLGSGGDTWIEIDGDVAAGDRVIVRGAERLSDGQTVEELDAVAGVVDSSNGFLSDADS